MFLFSLIFLLAVLFLITRTVMAAHERAAVAKPTINPASATRLMEDLELVESVGFVRFGGSGVFVTVVGLVVCKVV